MCGAGTAQQRQQWQLSGSELVGVRRNRAIEGSESRGAAATNERAASTGDTSEGSAPKVEREAERLQNVVQLTALDQSGGRAMGWRKEEGQAEANRVRTVKQLKKKLKVQPGDSGSWR